MRLVEDARQRGEQIIMTNGCFDLLHPGHVDYLEKAAALGDRLIVSLADRMAALAGLRSVDWVTTFSEYTPARLICETAPDVLVKGSDYRPEEIAGADCVRQTGDEVIVIDYVKGSSTTAIIDIVLNPKPKRSN